MNYKLKIVIFVRLTPQSNENGLTQASDHFL